jgi:tRNA(His) 5'-end guanylyltransferase
MEKTKEIKMKDPIGDRMKSYYEDRTRFKLTRRTNTIIRVDGKAFHTYTKGLQRPFDQGLMEDMNKTAEYLCQNIQGAKFAYVQSDEISILITDYDDIDTHAWFDGNLQKMASIAASLATAKFNQLRMARACSDSDGDLAEKMLANLEIEQFKLAMFDARVFQIPYQEEAINYFIWRQQDATRNSISSVAQSLYSAKELNGKKTSDMQEMIFQKGINWNDFTPREKRGSIISKVEKTFEIPAHWAYGENVIDSKFTRLKWEADPNTPIISQDKDYLRWFFPQTPDAKENKVLM